MRRVIKVNVSKEFIDGREPISEVVKVKVADRGLKTQQEINREAIRMAQEVFADRHNLRSPNGDLWIYNMTAVIIPSRDEIIRQRALLEVMNELTFKYEMMSKAVKDFQYGLNGITKSPEWERRARSQRCGIEQAMDIVQDLMVKGE